MSEPSINFPFTIHPDITLKVLSQALTDRLAVLRVLADLLDALEGGSVPVWTHNEHHSLSFLISSLTAEADELNNEMQFMVCQLDCGDEIKMKSLRQMLDASEASQAQEIQDRQQKESARRAFEQAQSDELLAMIEDGRLTDLLTTDADLRRIFVRTMAITKEMARMEESEELPA